MGHDGTAALEIRHGDGTVTELPEVVVTFLGAAGV
jgi:hypothetical protein